MLKQTVRNSIQILLILATPALFLGGCRRSVPTRPYHQLQQELQEITTNIPLPLVAYNLTVHGLNKLHDAHSVTFYTSFACSFAVQWYRAELERFGWNLETEVSLSDNSVMQWWNQPEQVAFFKFSPISEKTTAVYCCTAISGTKQDKELD